MSLSNINRKIFINLVSEMFCPFLNNYCELTNDITRFKQADAVVYHLRDRINQSTEIMKHRHSSQRFIFTLWESPINSPDLHSYNKFFNWSMTYRFDSHIFGSYYANIPYRLKEDHLLKSMASDYQSNEELVVLHENIDTTKKKGTAAALLSNVRQYELYILLIPFFNLVW
jgi:hypothetical protein